jgi:hypothetical protein
LLHADEGNQDFYSNYLPTKRSLMKKVILFAGFMCFVSMLCQGQSIDNRNWKAYLEAPISDTVTFHIHTDSSFVTNSNGQVVIRVNCSIARDTLTIVNLDGAETGCQDQKGKYKIDLKENSFKLTLIEDACEGRSQALTGVIWSESAKK